MKRHSGSRWRTPARALVLAAIGGLMAQWLPAPPVARGGTTTRVSLADDDATQGNQANTFPSISADGRYVAFMSLSDNLVPPDTNDKYDIFVRDVVGGTIQRITMAHDGGEPDGHSLYPYISATGRYVVFESDAANLVEGDTNGMRDAFLYDRQTQGTRRVSVAHDAGEPDGESRLPSVTDDGRYVAFDSTATNLVVDDQNAHCDVFVRDLVAGTTERVSIAQDGAEGNSSSYYGRISADGKLVAFHSAARNLVAGDTNWDWDTFVRDRQSQTTERVSVSSGGAEGSGDSIFPAVSPDGRYVVFHSFAPNLVPDDSNGTYDVFVRDRAAGTTERVSIGSDGAEGDGTSYAIAESHLAGHAAVSPDGRYVAFNSSAANLVHGDDNETWDVFVRDRTTGITERVSVPNNAGGAPVWSFWPAMSANGRYIAFHAANTLLPQYTHGNWTIFLRDREGTGPPTRQPDLHIRNHDELLYQGDGLYGIAQGQTKARTVFRGEPAIYHVLLENDGDRQDSFTVAGPGGAGGWTVSYYDAPTGGNDITSQVTGPTGWRTKSQAPTTRPMQLRIEVAPGPSVSAGATKQVSVTATSVLDPAKSDTVVANTTAAIAPGTPQPGMYTLDKHFDLGTLIGLEHDTVHDQLQLSPGSATLPFIWVPNSNEGTTSKVHTETGRELARYRTGPDAAGSPSRTAVDHQGSCWVGNRLTGTVVKIGLLEAGGHVDRNGNGTIETSRDLNGDGNITGDELLPWGQDECVLCEVVLIPGYEGTHPPGGYTGRYTNTGPRGLAVDRSNNLWVGTYETRRYYYIRGTDGQILRSVDISSQYHDPYGAVIDANGILWSAGGRSLNVLRLDPSDDSFSKIPFAHTPYGLGIDRNGHVFISGGINSKLSRLNVATGALDWTREGRLWSRGVVVTNDGDVWVADSVPSTVTRWSNDGVEKATIPAGNCPTGVSVDAAGKVWVVDYDDQYIRRIDPATNTIDLAKRIIGGHHYGYSDMTGFVARTVTTAIGTWTVIHDSGLADTPWGTLSWNEGMPDDPLISVRVRSSEDKQAWASWEQVSRAAALQATPNGRFLQVEARLERSSAGASPILCDLTVTPAPVARQPDMLVRNQKDNKFIGGDVYNLDGTGQTKSQTAPKGAAAVYPLKLQNDGNVTDSFVVSGSAGDARWTVCYHDAPTGGTDITSAVTGSGWAMAALRPGDAVELRVEVTPMPAAAVGASKAVLVTASSVGEPAKRDAVKTVTIADPPPAPPQPGMYTYDEDFDLGTLFGVEHETVHDQLQLSQVPTTLPFIWVPNSNQGTVSKVHTETGRELARYRTGPGADGSPSRTAVDLQGNCWVGNRAAGTVVKIGLLENGAYEDRNNNGIIDTSSDTNGDGDITGDEILPWGQDECVLCEVVLIPGSEGTHTPGGYTGTYSNTGPRGIAVDASNNVWAGTYETKKYYYIRGSDGEILKTIDVAPHTPYGAVIDANGMLWSAGALGQSLLRLDPLDDSFSTLALGHVAYGLGLDENGHLFVSGWSDSKLSRVDVASATKEWTRNGKYQSRGVAVTQDGDVWVADSGPGTVTRWSNDGTQIKATISVGSAPTGVAVDAAGQVWCVNWGDEFIKRIDPSETDPGSAVDLSKRIVGGYHYGYSDMTGRVAGTITTSIGTWTVIHDSEADNAPWGTLSWHSDEPGRTATPPTTSITVRVRSSNDLAHWSRWEQAAGVEQSGDPEPGTLYGAELTQTPAGRYIQIQVTFQRRSGQASPVLYDLSVYPTIAGLCVDDSNATGLEDGSNAHPFRTIQGAIGAASAGSTIKVARGIYRESLTIEGRWVWIVGGYVGGTYPGTGDFSEANREPAANPTLIDGSGSATQAVCQDAAARGSGLAGLTFRNGGAILRGGLVLKRVVAESGP